jgi:hypothetical protein
MPISSVKAVQHVNAGQAPSRLSNIVDGMEFKSPDELKEFVRSRSNQIRLRPGKSFMVYLEKSAPNPYGAHRQSIEGFNKETPYFARVVTGKKAGCRMPGEWVKITAKDSAKSGAKDQLKVVDRQTVMCRPPISKTLFAMTITVV